MSCTETHRVLAREHSAIHEPRRSLTGRPGDTWVAPAAATSAKWRPTG